MECLETPSPVVSTWSTRTAVDGASHLAARPAEESHWTVDASSSRCGQSAVADTDDDDEMESDNDGVRRHILVDIRFTPIP
jgi:hypothetical protein